MQTVKNLMPSENFNKVQALKNPIPSENVFKVQPA
jgi:hypothetical protein